MRTQLQGLSRKIFQFGFFSRNLHIDAELVLMLIKMIASTRTDQSLKNILGPGSRVRNVLTWA